MRVRTPRGSLWVLAAGAVLVCSCASELEESGRPFTLVNTRVLPFVCVTSPVPDEVVGRVEDAEAKFQAHGQPRTAIGVAHRAKVGGADLSGVYVVLGLDTSATIPPAAAMPPSWSNESAGTANSGDGRGADRV